MAKLKLNLTHTGVSNESIIGFIEYTLELKDIADKLKPYINDDRKFYEELFDNFDIVFDIDDEQSTVDKDIYTVDGLEKGSFKYNFIVDYVMKLSQKFTKNGHTPKRTNFR